MTDHAFTPWASGPCIRCGAPCDSLHVAAGEPLCGGCCPECRSAATGGTMPPEKPDTEHGMTTDELADSFDKLFEPLEGPVRAGVAGVAGERGKLW